VQKEAKYLFNDMTFEGATLIVIFYRLIILYGNLCSLIEGEMTSNSGSL